MSYRNTKVNGVKPDANGNISVAFDTLFDVTGTPTTGQVLAYNATAGTWSPTSTGAGSGFALFGQGESNNYTNSGFALTAGSTWGVYDSAPINHTSGAVTFNYVAGTSWLSSFNLTAGDYHIFAQFAGAFSASGYLAVACYSGATAVSGIAVTGASLATYGGTPSTLCFAVSPTATVQYTLKIYAQSNLSTSQGTTPAEYGTLLIQRV